MRDKRHLTLFVLLNLAAASSLVVIIAHRSSRPELGPYSRPYALLLASTAAALLLMDVLLLHPTTRQASVRLLGRGLILAVGLAVGLAVAEVAARLYPLTLQGPPALDAGGPSESLFLPDPVLHHVFRASARVCYGGPEYDVEVSTNAAGFRDRERAPTPGEGTCRVAVVGDSFVAGLEVEADEVWTSRLESMLAPSVPGLEILNFGVPAYSPALEAVLVRDVVLAYEPTVVLLNFCPNDIYEDHHYGSRYLKDEQGGLVSMGQREAGRLSRLAEAVVLGVRPHSALVRLAEQALHAWRYRRRAAFGLGPAFAEEYSGADREALRRSLEHVLRTARMVRQAGAQFAVVSIPYPNQVATEEWDRGKLKFGFEAEVLSGENPQRLAAAWLQQRGVSFIDLLPEIKKRRDERLYYREDTHPNAAGHRLIAELLSERLRTTEAWLLDGCIRPVRPGR